ncbi:MAG: ATP-grasp domain-containing protein [Myxococcales bacterium]|nr:ATP-grasp domain-containing protein [Myxococcales bacterium]
MRAFTGTVAVTGLNATDNPGPGVAVIRALRADPLFQGQIVGLAYDALDPGVYLPGLLDAAFMVPYPSAGRGAIFERLAYIKHRVGLDVLLPTLDSELPAFLDQEETLRAMGIGTFLPTRAQYEQRAKARLHELRTQHGVAVPDSEPIYEAHDLIRLGQRMGYPLVVKGVFYGAEICHTHAEAVGAFHKAAAKWGLPIIVQQYIPGDDLCVAAVGDGQGGLIGAVPMKKLMVTDKGKGWAGVTVQDEPLMALTRDVMRALKWRGPCEVEALRDAAGGYHLLEINPRFPAWVDLSMGAGNNLPMAAVRLSRGEPVAPQADYIVGAAFVRASVNQIVNIADLAPLSTIGELHPDSQTSRAFA